MVQSHNDKYYSLKEWNNEHERLWRTLARLNVVNINDCDKFIKFGDFFEDHIELNERSPTLNECIDFFKFL